MPKGIPGLLRIILLALALGLPMAGGCAAQENPSPGPESTATPRQTSAVPDDPFGRGTPRSSAEGFLNAARDGDYALASQYLDLSHLPDQQAAQGPRLARQLWFVLERQAKMDFAALSPYPNGVSQSGQTSNRLARIEWPGGLADIDLEQAQEPGQGGVWKICPRSVAKIPKLYDRFRLPVAEVLFSEATLDSLLRTHVFHLSGITWFAIALCLFVWAILFFLALALARRLVRAMKPGGPANLASAIHVPVVLLIVTSLVRFLIPPQLITIEIARIFHAQTIFIVVTTWILFRVADFLSEQARRKLLKEDGNTGLHLINLVRRIAKVMLVVIGFVVWLDNLGFRVTTIIASLGIIGLAVGLASQKFIEDLIGAMTLHATGIVKRNELIGFGDQQGVVEDIGLRMTRIRGRDRGVITLPNAMFATMQIKNLGRRDKFLFEACLGLRYETSPDQLRHVLSELVKLLGSHPKVEKETARARFTSFGASSLDIQVYCFVMETSMPDYLAVAEDLNLRMMDIVSKAGTGFAFPSQTVYWGRDQGLDEALSRQAEAEVRRQREQGELPSY